MKRIVLPQRIGSVAARNGALHPAAQPDRWRLCIAADLLAAAWALELAVRLTPPLRSGPWAIRSISFPGTVLMILLFTSIFSTISIIEDRKEGFLQAVLVAPVPRSALVFGKLLGGTSLALMQGVLFMLLAPLVGIPVSRIPATLLMLTLVAFGLTALGYVIAWNMDSTQGFHAIMNLFLIPMWLLCGAVFPASGAPGWLRVVMELNPLTYGMSAVRWSIYGQGRRIDDGYSWIWAVCWRHCCVRRSALRSRDQHDETAGMRLSRSLITLMLTGCAGSLASPTTAPFPNSA